MGTKMLKSLKGRTIRLTRLDACGAPVVGACSSIVSEGFITVSYAAEVEAGDQYLQKNAWGDLCISEKDPDRTKWVNIGLSLCEVNPDILTLVGGGTAVTDGTDTIGASFGVDGALDAFALEVWTKQAGRSCAGSAPEWGYFVAPFVTNGNLDGSIDISNAALTVGLKGEGQQATDDWGVNPYGDNPLLAVAGFPAGDFWAVVRTTVAPPEATDGCVALAA